MRGLIILAVAWCLAPRFPRRRTVTAGLGLDQAEAVTDDDG